MVETAVITMPAESFEHLCSNFVDDKGRRTRLFKDLLFDPIGNYISTKLMEKAKVYGLQKVNNHFQNTFNESVDALRKQKHGRQLISKIQSIRGGKKASSSSSSVASKSQIS